MQAGIAEQWLRDAGELLIEWKVNSHKAGLKYRSRPISQCNRSAPFVALGPMSITVLRRRRPRGINLKGRNLQQLLRENGYKLPEHLEMAEVNALIAAAPTPKARLVTLEQWRAGLRESEALALEARDLHLDSDRPPLFVRQGMGR